MEASEHRPLARGASLAAGSRIAVAVSGAATTILVARLLGPSGAGAFAVALTVVLMLTTFGSIGVEHGIAYYVSGKAWAPRPAFRTALRTALVLGLAGAGLGLGLRALAPDAFSGLTLGQVAIVVAALPCALTWFLGSWVALAVDRYEAYVLPPAVQSIVALVLVAILGATHDLGGALVGLALSHVVAAGVTLWLARGLPAGEEPALPLQRALSFGLRSYGANALQFMNFRLDLFVLSAVAGNDEVGFYAVAISATSVLLLLPAALSEVLFPRVAALSAGEDHAHRDFVEAKSLRHLALLAVVSGAVLAVAAALLIEPVYGEDFSAAVEPALILVPGVALLGIAGALGASIVGRGRPGLALVIAGVMTPLTIGLYLVLVPALEVQGAAIASTLSYAGTFLLSAFLYGRLSGHNVARLLVPTRDEIADYRSLLRRA